jgi:1-acyl-sn-glycerol-3-phosphate acyltransferase
MNENYFDADKSEKNENDHTYESSVKRKPYEIKKGFKYYRTSKIFKLLSKIAFFLFALFCAFWLKKFRYKYKVIGKKNLKKVHGAVLISNHVFKYDAALFLSSLKTKSIIYPTMLNENMGYGFFSLCFRMAGASPIPDGINQFKSFYRQTISLLENKENILFFPEASMHEYADHIRPFKHGGFRFAMETNKIIVPVVTTFHKPKGWFKWIRKGEPTLTTTILKPYVIEDLGNKKLTLEKAMKDVYEIISSYYLENSDYFKN